MAKSTFDEIGPWSEVKLAIVRDYATEYTKVLSKQSAIRRFVYIDAFAGAGQHVSKTTGDFVLGSPANALLVSPPFDEFHFIDLQRTRVRRLRELGCESQNVTVYEGDCNEILHDKVFPRCRWNDFARALCLLDPYKLNVNWDILQAAGREQSIEVFYNLMIMDANMNVFRRNPDKTSEAQAERMTAVWGDDSWRQAAYTKRPGLFFDIEEKATNDRVAEAFRKRLHEVAGFQYVPRPIPMRNSIGAVVYYLYFASPNKTGAKIVDHIFRKYGR